MIKKRITKKFSKVSSQLPTSVFSVRRMNNIMVKPSIKKKFTMRQDIDIFNEALADDSACDLDTPTSMARLLLGVKIVRDNETGVVKIYDTSRSSFYREVSPEERKVFSKSGWRAGVLEVFNTRYGRRLAKLWRTSLMRRTLRIEQGLSELCNVRLPTYLTERLNY